MKKKNVTPDKPVVKLRKLVSVDEFNDKFGATIDGFPVAGTSTLMKSKSGKLTRRLTFHANCNVKNDARYKEIRKMIIQEITEEHSLHF